jgi:hypothetical protein
VEWKIWARVSARLLLAGSLRQPIGDPGGRLRAGKVVIREGGGPAPAAELGEGVGIETRVVDGDTEQAALAILLVCHLSDPKEHPACLNIKLPRVGV